MTMAVTGIRLRLPSGECKNHEIQYRQCDGWAHTWNSSQSTFRSTRRAPSLPSTSGEHALARHANYRGLGANTKPKDRLRRRHPLQVEGKIFPQKPDSQHDIHLTLDSRRPSPSRTTSPRTCPHGTLTARPRARRPATTRMSTSSPSPSTRTRSVSARTSWCSPSAGTRTARPTSTTTATRRPS